MKKADLYDTYSSKIKKITNKKITRRTIPHSSPKDNVEGLLELQISQRIRSQSGIRKNSKKRAFKQIPPQTRDAIAKMYHEKHVIQKDVAKYYSISPNVVSRIVKEY